MVNYILYAISLMIGLIIGLILGSIIPKNITLIEFLKKIVNNLDNFILVTSAVIVFTAICLESAGKLETFSSIAINVFGSMIFSWLLTKKSAKEEFKKQEEELALRSYRHINYIDSSANTAYKKIQTYLDNEQLDPEIKLMLSSAMDQIKYIQGGISTCKMDWYDMLSEDEKAHYKGNIPETEEATEKYGEIKIEMPESNYNQEDA